VLLAMFIGLAWQQRVPSLTTANDDAVYLLLSRSLRDGGYNSIHLVGTPVHTKYPPVFPALLAGVSWVAGESIDAFVAMNIALSVLGLSLLFAVARRRLPPTVALGGLAIGASNPFLQGSAGTVLSEPAFLAIVALTIWLLAREPRTAATIALACVCATAAALTRTIGATLVLAVIVLLLAERRWRAAGVYAGILALCVVAVSLWLRVHAMPDLAADYITDATDPGTHQGSNPLAVLARRVMTNVPDYARGVLWLLSFPTIGGTAADNVFWILIAGVAIAAGLWVFWRQWRIVTLWSVIYGALIVAWPWPVGRFLVPLIPLIALAMLAGAHGLVRRWSVRAAPAIVLILAVILSVTGIVHGAAKISMRSQCDRQRPMQAPSCFSRDQLSFFAAARWVGEETPPSAIVLSANEGTFFYLSGRRLVPVDSLNARPPARAAEFLRSRNVAYVVMNHVTYEDLPLADRLSGACEYLEPVREFPPRTTIFRVRAGPSGGSAACDILREFRRTAGDFQEQVF
jgi:4-amino-4-deoxy-L-arabinose transferase-like glycosyltransferase